MRSKPFKVGLIMVGIAGMAGAQPVISSGGVKNAGSARFGLPNAGVAQGALFVVSGRNLGPAEGARAEEGSSPTELGGTVVKVTSGGNTVDVPLVYSTPMEIGARLPADTAIGDATLSVSYKGDTTAQSSAFSVVSASFGAFTVNSRDNASDVFRSFISQGYLPLNDLDRPLKPGEQATLWGSGLGSLDGDIQVFINDKQASIVDKQRADCCSGIERIVFAVPDGVEGCSLPVAVKTGEVTNLVAVVSVAADGVFCPDRNGFTAGDLAKAKEQGYLKAGYMFLMRYAEPTSGQSLDIGWANFTQIAYEQIRDYRGRTSQAVPGACSIVTTDGFQSSSLGGMPGPDFFDDFYPFGDTSLDAGPMLNLTGPSGTQQMQSIAPGLYSNVFFNFTNPLQSYLAPGNYTLDNGGGGSQVSGFRAELRIDPPVAFTGVPNSIARSKDLVVNWNGGGPNDRVLIVGMAGKFGSSPLDVVFGITSCYEQASKGKLTIPASMLSQMPAAGNDGTSMALLFMYSTSMSQRFQPSSGLDAGYVMSLTYSGKPVSFE